MGLFTNYNKQIDALIANKPQYNINPEYSQNEAIAKGKAYGRNRAFQTQETNIEQQSANDVNTAQQYGSSVSSILNTLSSITGSKQNALRGIGQDEAMYQGQALNDVMGTNTAMAEEKDKAWNFNVNQPFQLKMNQLVQQKKARNELLSKLLDAGLGAATLGLGGQNGILGKKKKPPLDETVPSYGSGGSWDNGLPPGDQSSGY